MNGVVLVGSGGYCEEQVKSDDKASLPGSGGMFQELQVKLDNGNNIHLFGVTKGQLLMYRKYISDD